jgi:hypothetical protein
MDTISKQASSAKRRSRHEKVVRLGYFVFAALLHLILFIMLASYVIFEAPPQRGPSSAEFSTVTVKPPPPPELPTSGGASLNPTIEPDAVVSPPAQATAVTHVPDSAFKMDTAKIINDAVEHGLSPPQGSGLDRGSGGQSGAGNGLFGSGDTSGGLVGTFYDLKQTPEHQPTSMAETGAELDSSDAVKGWQKLTATRQQISALHDFVENWDTIDLDTKYLHLPDTLSAVQIFIPLIPSRLAPLAFKADTSIHPRRWIVVYKGTINPPKDGTFRFIGVGDDFLVVRIDDTNVLDGSYPSEKVDPKANVKEDVGRGPGYLGVPLFCGQWFRAYRGSPMTMQVLIGEGPGGNSSMFLMIDDRDNPSPKGDYPVFQLQNAPVPGTKGSNSIPPAFSGRKFLFAPDS